MRTAFLVLAFAQLVGETRALAAEPAHPLDPGVDGGDVFGELSLDALLQVQVASVRAESIYEAPSAVSVIDRAMLDLYDFRRVSEAIETLAGVTVVRTYIKRQMPTIRGLLQDHYANKVLVLIDGVPAWHAVTGEGNIDRVGIEEVERIEILRGPASVLYGTNAYSGAINIVLKKATTKATEGQSGELAAGIGNHRHFDASGGYSYRAGGLSLRVSGTASDERGKEHTYVDEKAARGNLNEFLRGGDFNLQLDYKTRYGSHGLSFNGYRTEESYLGITPDWLAGAGDPHVVSGYLGAYTYQVDFADLVDLRARTFFDWSQRDASRGRSATDAAADVHASITGWRTGGNLTSVLTPLEWLELQLGADADLRHSDEYANYDTRTREVIEKNNMENRSAYELSLFGQAKLGLRPLVPALPITLLGGVRWTNNESFSSNVSARGALVYEVFDGSSIKLTAGQSYRAPTLFELYFQTSNNTVVGNLDLQPEKATTAEVAYLIGGRDFFAQALGYWAKYENKIFRVRRDPSSMTDKSTIYINGQPFSAYGAELEAHYSNPDVLDAFATYSYTRGTSGDEVAGNNVYNFHYVAHHEATVGLGRRFYGFGVSTVVNYFGTRHGQLAEIPAQFTWDLNLGYDGDVLHHRLSMKNVLDEEVMTPEYTRRTINAVPSGTGRSLYYTLQASF